MISIGKVYDPTYYLEELTVDDAAEYYTTTEQPATWRGSLAPSLGLEGRIDPDAFE